MKFNEKTGAAITNLCPNGWAWNGGDIKVVSDPKPTDVEIQAEMDRLEAEYDAQEYARKRASDYPSYGEQFDLLYHSGIDGLKAELKKTKDKYPK